MKMDMNKMMKQVQEMQAQMAQAQEELAKETVEASAGGGIVRVKASGAGEITEIKIAPEAIDPEDPEMLEDLVLAAVSDGLRRAHELQGERMGNVTGGLDLGSLGGLLG
jgi:nucleoid-associated protein EbfC